MTTTVSLGDKSKIRKSCKKRKKYLHSSKQLFSEEINTLTNPKLGNPAEKKNIYTF